LRRGDPVVGVDVGITSLLTLSTWEKIANPRHERRDRARLALAQRRLARTQKGSANRDKARLKVARVHARITDHRKGSASVGGNAGTAALGTTGTSTPRSTSEPPGWRCLPAERA
jgi:Probable transposase